jgi:hypothetical protein
LKFLALTVIHCDIKFRNIVWEIVVDDENDVPWWQNRGVSVEKTDEGYIIKGIDSRKFLDWAIDTYEEFEKAK